MKAELIRGLVTWTRKGRVVIRADDGRRVDLDLGGRARPECLRRGRRVVLEIAIGLGGHPRRPRFLGSLIISSDAHVAPPGEIIPLALRDMLIGLARETAVVRR